MIEIPKFDSGHEDSTACEPGKPAWMSVEDTKGNKLKPLIRCNCGKWCGIGLHHVHADGTVTASFLHGKADFTHNGKQYPGDPDGCEWHVFLKLLNYSGGEFLPEG